MNINELAEELETKKWQLLLASDVDGITSLLSDDLYYLHSSGLEDGKKRYIDKLRDGTFTYHRINHQIESITALGEPSFFITGIVNIDATVSGAEKQMHSRFLSIWRSENKEWKLVAQQTTAAPQA